MESARYLWLSGLIASTTDLYLTHKSSFALDRPVQTTIAVLLVTGLALVTLSYTVPGVFKLDAAPSDYASIPLTQGGAKVGSTDRDAEPDFNRMRSRSLSYSQANQFSTHRLRLTFLLLVAAVCVRVELSRWILGNIQCADLKLSTWIPLLIIFYESFCCGTSKAISSNILPNARGSSRLSSLGSGSLRYIPPILALSIGAALLVGELGSLRSTYICASGLANKTLIPFLQVIGTGLDAATFVLAAHLIFGGPENNPYASQRSPVYVGFAFLASCALISLNGMLVYFAVPSKREWINAVQSEYIWATIRFTIDVALAAICVCQAICQFGARNASVICLFIYINVQSILGGWFRSWPFPPVSKLSLAFAILFIFGGFISFLWVDGSANKGIAPLRVNRKPSRLTFALGVLIAIQVSFWILRPRFIYHKHPIDVLIHEAEMAHVQWLRQASNSSTVYQAAANYRERYHQDPPPRFDKWFEYAQARNSTIIDDYDSIHRDLLPFWAMEPREIRARTYHMMANDWNNIGGITIRKDNISISPFVEESHKWMLQGIVHLIEPFVQYLPDMDLAFNMDDESRVAVPYNHLQKIMHNATTVAKLPAREDGDFSSVRHDDWAKLPEDPIKDTIFVEKFANRTFRDYGSVGCSPKSKARSESQWDLGSVCESCVKAHSHHNFVRNWTYAADPCHQPDLANFHGLHLSPSTFRVTHELMPLFSQSKAHGFQDILYPSAWNYGNRSAYNVTHEFLDPEWNQKEPTFYWRGRTSEGLSFENGLWKGMARQRLVHHFNNASSSQRNLVILPTGNTASYHDSNHNQPIYTYRHLTPPVLHQQISTDVRFVDRIERCVRRDCDNQYTEFAPQYVANSSFQAHWRYKYLMDLDGAGFSGRFLAFLYSKSLPFKSSLMREWWDDRVTAWAHFVPVDVRLTEVWSLLAYFAGWKIDPHHAENEKPKWLMRPHDREASQIAADGSEWAQQVLRREDMEIYMFRLLLEWGRLTDDHRDSLGWTGDQ